MNTGNSGPRSIEASTNRSCMVGPMLAFCVAIHHSPTEMAIVTTSFVRARRPSDRRLTILV